MAKPNIDDLLKLEKVVKKVIRNAFKDSSLDYTCQFSVSSLEPGVVKYSFMINGTKKEIRVEPQVFTNYETVLAVAEGMLKEINLVELEKTFHQSRINTHKTAQEQHEARLAQLEKGEVEEDDIPMELV